MKGLARFAVGIFSAVLLSVVIAQPQGAARQVWLDNALELDLNAGNLRR
ncbi:MAG: hypothetical protein QXI60_07175 [Thermofilaceae archaeon]